MISILNPKFRYTSAAATDLKKTFARVRRELEARKKVDENHRKILAMPTRTLIR